jgi:hypothetical protein
MVVCRPVEALWTSLFARSRAIPVSRRFSINVTDEVVVARLYVVSISGQSGWEDSFQDARQVLAPPGIVRLIFNEAYLKGAP